MVYLEVLRYLDEISSYMEEQEEKIKNLEKKNEDLKLLLQDFDSKNKWI